MQKIANIKQDISFKMKKIAIFIVGIFIFALLLPGMLLSPNSTSAATPSIGGNVSVSAKLLNVRSSPGLASTILGTQSQNARGIIIDGPKIIDGNTWWKIDYEIGSDGWSAKKYLSIGSSAVLGIKLQATKFQIGDNISVSARVNVRSSPTSYFGYLGYQRENSKGKIVGGPQYANGYTWWKIDYVTRPDGWSVEKNLVLVSSASIPPTCTSWTYSNWTTCSSAGQQTRAVVTSLPSGCIGGTPILSQLCIYTSPTGGGGGGGTAPLTCTSWTYSGWGTCSSAGQQTRTIVTSLPSGCTSGNPVLSQSCTYTPPTGGGGGGGGGTTAPVTCTSWTYSDWTTCSSSGQQTRTVSTFLPSGCTSGNPVLSQSCTYTPPLPPTPTLITCTSWTYSDWATCSSNSQQTRTIATSLPSGCTGGSPVLSQSCIYTPPTCTSWTYSDWTTCSSSGQQTRTVSTSLPSGCTGGSPVLNQSCTPTISNLTQVAGWRTSDYGTEDPTAVKQSDSAYYIDVSQKMAEKFSGSNPGGIYTVGYIETNTTMLPYELKDVASSIPSVHIDESGVQANPETMLNSFDAAGLSIILAVEPGRADVVKLAQAILNKYKNHPSVKGFGVDNEWYMSENNVMSAATAIALKNAVTAINPAYKTIIKHFDSSKLPIVSGVVYLTDTCSFSSRAAAVDSYVAWANTFAGSEIGYQFGYDKMECGTPDDSLWWKPMGTGGQPALLLIQDIKARVPTADIYSTFWADFTILTQFPK